MLELWSESLTHKSRYIKPHGGKAEAEYIVHQMRGWSWLSIFH